MKDKLVITPRTKVSQLLQTYPELESILIKTVPAFEKLQNPILRKTVASITSLQQAASIGNVGVDDLINTLRQAAGQDLIKDSDETHYVTDKPTWYDDKLVTQELDARPMLAAGEHPVNLVLAHLATLENGKLYKLTTPFLPAPLIDKASSLGFEHWVNQHTDTLFDIYFCKLTESV